MIKLINSIKEVFRMKKIAILKSGRSCFSRSEMFARFFILLPLILSAGCAGSGYFAGKDVALEHFTKREIAVGPYKIVQDKKSFYIVRDIPDQNPADKPQVSEYRLLKGSFMGVASDNQANMIARLVAESHNLQNTDLKSSVDEITASIRAVSSSTEDKFLALESRISALENKVRELSSSISASANITKKEIELVSHDTQRAMTEVLSLKSEMRDISSEIIILFPKGKHTLSNFEEERFVRFLDNLTNVARKRRLYFAILSKESSLSQRRTSSLAFTIDRYLGEVPHEIKISLDHDAKRDKDTVLVGAAFDPDHLPKPKEVNAAEEMRPISKEHAPADRGTKHKTNPTGNNAESAPSISVKEKEDKRPTAQDKSEKALKSIPTISHPPSTEEISGKLVPVEPGKASNEQGRGQRMEPKKDKDKDQDDPNIEELRQILMDSGKRRH